MMSNDRTAAICAAVEAFVASLDRDDTRPAALIAVAELLRAVEVHTASLADAGKFAASFERWAGERRDEIENSGRRVSSTATWEARAFACAGLEFIHRSRKHSDNGPKNLAGAASQIARQHKLRALVDGNRDLQKSLLAWHYQLRNRLVDSRAGILYREIVDAADKILPVLHGHAPTASELKTRGNAFLREAVARAHRSNHK
jgi:hypothetical protein